MSIAKGPSELAESVSPRHLQMQSLSGTSVNTANRDTMDKTEAEIMDAKTKRKYCSKKYSNCYVGTRTPYPPPFQTKVNVTIKTFTVLLHPLSKKDTFQRFLFKEMITF